jgi:hypothetical protein
MSDDPDPIIDRMTALAAAMDSTLARIEAMHASLDLHAVGRLEAGQTQLRVDLMARMDQLQDSITSIRDDIAVNMGGVEAVRNVNDNMRDDLKHMRDDLKHMREALSVMYRRMLALETNVRGLQQRDER